MKELGVNCTEASERMAQMTEAFRDGYGSEPTLGVRAPGRVDLMGSHTDYNEGCVLTLPIDRETWILARPRDDSRVRFSSLNLTGQVTFSGDSPEDHPREDWGRYVQGVAVELHRAGYPVRGCDALVHGTVPPASGLSSSASLEAACATLFEQLGSFALGRVEMAKLTQRAENSWVGVNCGILDQYSCILGEQGKALVLDCRSLTHTYAAFPPDLRVVICNTCAPRQLSGSEYGDRRAQCEAGAAFFAEQDPAVKALRDVSLERFEHHAADLPEAVSRRSRFIIEEHARVATLAAALASNDRRAIAGITEASFAGARDLFEISVPAMQAMYDAMQQAPGCAGCRQAGAGFGGCMVAFVEREHVDRFCHEAAFAYQAAAGLAPEIYPIRTAPGAGVLQLP